MVQKSPTEPGVLQSFTFVCNHCQKQCNQGGPPEYIQMFLDKERKTEPAKFNACTDCYRLIQAYNEEQEYLAAEEELGRPIERRHKPQVLAVLKKQEMALEATAAADKKAAEPVQKVAELTQQVDDLKAAVAQLLAEKQNGTTTTRATSKPKSTKKAAGTTARAGNGRAAKPVPGTGDAEASTESNGKNY